MIALTPVAADKVKELLTGRGTPQVGLRIGRRRGGCSGSWYLMQFCEAEPAGAEVIDANAVKLVVDLKSVVLLGGAEIDYGEGLMGPGFKFNNPNVKHSC